MVCPTCKTAIEENANACPYCEKNFSKRRRLVMAAMLCGLGATVAMTGIYIQRTAQGLNNNQVQQAAVLMTETIEPRMSSIERNNIQPTPSPTSTPPVYAADTNRREDEIWSLIENMAITVNDYYGQNQDIRVIISKNGYMYNYTSNSYYTPRNFSRIESMNPEHLDEQVLILYMRPNDVRAYLPDPTMLELSNDLWLFCAHEVRDGFAIAWRDGRIGTISLGDFQRLVALYSDEHGEAFRPANDTPEFAEIIAGINRFKSDNKNYDVRYLTYDSKYAFVVLSETDMPDRLEQFLLIRGIGEWHVELFGLESMFMYQKTINNAYPDFNIGMLPAYNLFYLAHDIRVNISPLIDAMRAQGAVVPEDGNETFASGTDKFCYIEFEGGKKLLTVYTGVETGWTIYEINDFMHAEMIMRLYEKDAPTYILRQ